MLIESEDEFVVVDSGCSMDVCNDVTNFIKLLAATQPATLRALLLASQDVSNDVLCIFSLHEMKIGNSIAVGYICFQ